MTKQDRFRPLYQKHYRRVVQFFRRVFRVSEEDAQDFAQETFLRFFQGMDEYRGDAEWAYLEQIARNLAFNKFRSQKTIKRTAHLVDLDDPEFRFEIAAPPEPDYADRQEMARRKQRFEEEIERLPAGQRQAVQLRRQGFKYQEIAKSLRTTTDAVKSRLRDATKTLRERLGEVIGLPEDES